MVKTDKISKDKKNRKGEEQDRSIKHRRLDEEHILQGKLTEYIEGEEELEEDGDPEIPRADPPWDQESLMTFEETEWDMASGSLRHDKEGKEREFSFPYAGEYEGVSWNAQAFFAKRYGGMQERPERHGRRFRVGTSLVWWTSTVRAA